MNTVSTSTSSSSSFLVFTFAHMPCNAMPCHAMPCHAFCANNARAKWGNDRFPIERNEKRMETEMGWDGDGSKSCIRKNNVSLSSSLPSSVLSRYSLYLLCPLVLCPLSHRETPLAHTVVVMRPCFSTINISLR